MSKVGYLNESFILGVYSFIQVKYLGGFHVLLMGEDEIKVKEATEENKEWFKELFDTIAPWKDPFVAVDKLVWVHCRGIPLKLWNVECFEKIVALLETLVEADKATLERSPSVMERRWALTEAEVSGLEGFVPQSPRPFLSSFTIKMSRGVGGEATTFTGSSLADGKEGDLLVVDVPSVEDAAKNCWHPATVNSDGQRTRWWKKHSAVSIGGNRLS